ncbi:hypothetical protein BJ875DRAFT_473041 [Amylocarpus encephaloides]|uniref:Uncharacterized protein n=1 Tax=Amylocarpus encephaloides TaxID=45428 RepID=A0A9P7YA18_9HELO|nr:hypothetical protein BJ875DRAFT_473041 [Amylocarpus encephaloides]
MIGTLTSSVSKSVHISKYLIFLYLLWLFRTAANIRLCKVTILADCLETSLINSIATTNLLNQSRQKLALV